MGLFLFVVIPVAIVVVLEKIAQIWCEIQVKSHNPYTEYRKLMDKDKSDKK